MTTRPTPPDDRRASSSGGPAAEPPRTVLERVAARTGDTHKVTLPDETSRAAASPVIDASSPDARALPSGRGNYQILGEIARGGMGVILKGHDRDLGRDVAMKVLLEKHAGSDAILQRFVEEAQIGGQLQHPGIVPVYELGLMNDERPYFTMKLVKGRTLARLLAERASPADDRRRFVAIFEKVCETVAYAHSRNVIHRDLKPANIMVGAFGEVQVVDWGLAKVLGTGACVADERPAQQTQVSIIETVRSGSTAAGTESLVGSVMGTPAYMPPEQAQGEIDRLDERSDVFALGAILCEILTGKPPYVGEHDDVVVEAAQALLDGCKQRLAGCQADPELVAIALRCLAPARAPRPRSAEALLQLVHDYLASVEERTHRAQVEAAEARVRVEQEQKARRLTLALAGTVLLAVVGGAAGWVELQRRESEHRASLGRKVDLLLDEVAGHRTAGDFAAARASLQGLEAFLATSDPDPALAERLANAREETEQAAARAEQARAEAARVAAFLAQLDGLIVAQAIDVENRDIQRQRRSALAAAFADYGVEPTGSERAAMVERLRDTGRPIVVAQAVDEWARTERNVNGWNAPLLGPLTELASALDQDPQRVALRVAILEDDRAALERLVASAEARTWPPATVVMLTLALRDIGQRIDVLPLLRTCQLRHPDDPILNQILAGELADQDPRDDHEILRFLTAAHAVRPDNANAAARMAWTLARLGRLEEAMATYDQGVRSNPDAAWLLGRGLEIFRDSVDDEHKLDVILSALEAALEAAPDNPEARNNLAWYLLLHPDPARRDPQRAAEYVEAALEEQPEEATFWNTLGIAQLRLGRWRDAVTSLEQGMRLGGTVHESDVLGLAIALDELGQPAKALQLHRQALELRGRTGEGDWELADLRAELDARFGGQ